MRVLKSVIKVYNIQSTFDNPELLLSGHLLFGQSFPPPKLFIIPLHVSIRKGKKKIHCKSEFYNPEKM